MMRFFSYGGGVQSTAVLVLAAQRNLMYHEFLFANVGEDSENPETLKYFREYAQPFADDHGLVLTEIYGNKYTILEECYRDNKRSPIPMRFAGSGDQGFRTCTVDWKIKPIAKYVSRIYQIKFWIMGLGISTDEIHRAKTTELVEILPKKFQKKEYPLIDLRLSRNDCFRIINNAGLPMPPKSSCWFCPLHQNSYWREMKEDRPETFDRVAKLEEKLRLKRPNDNIYIHRNLKPLYQAVESQTNYFDELDICESGYCMV